MWWRTKNDYFFNLKISIFMMRVPWWFNLNLVSVLVLLVPWWFIFQSRIHEKAVPPAVMFDDIKWIRVDSLLRKRDDRRRLPF